MLSETVKRNLNKLDFDLKQIYSAVKITEKTTHNQFFYQIEAVGNFQVFENQKNLLMSLVLIEKNNLNFDTVTWKYSVNPLDINSENIERVSKIEELAKDIHSTITKKQMDFNYLRSSPIAYEMINESVSKPKRKITLEDKILGIVENFNVEVEFTDVENNNGRKSLKIYHKGIKVSDKFILENKINNFKGVSFISFFDDHLKVNLNN